MTCLFQGAELVLHEVACCAWVALSQLQQDVALGLPAQCGGVDVCARHRHLGQPPQQCLCEARLHQVMYMLRCIALG